jgi:uncharacterized membrane protein YfcA
MVFLDHTLSEWLLRLVLGAGIGFCVGLTGVGGGILGVQATLFILAGDAVKAVGTTSLYLFLTNIAASVQHYRLGNLYWKMILPILTGAIPANVACSLLISSHSQDDGIRTTLSNLILFIVFVAIIAMAVNLMKKTVDPDEQAGGRLKSMRTRQIIGFIFGIAFGAILGATSAGGGVLLVPALILLGLTSHKTVGSAVFITMTLTCISAFIYASGGIMDRFTAITMAAGSLAGVWAGSRCSVGISDRTLKKIMLAIIFAIASAMLIART